MPFLPRADCRRRKHRFSCRAATPAADYLFAIWDKSEAKYLPEEQAVAFHHTVVQLLFLLARARSEIGVAMSFLASRVKRPNKDDWGKVKRCYGTCTERSV